MILTRGQINPKKDIHLKQTRKDEKRKVQQQAQGPHHPVQPKLVECQDRVQNGEGRDEHHRRVLEPRRVDLNVVLVCVANQ